MVVLKIYNEADRLVTVTRQRRVFKPMINQCFIEILKIINRQELELLGRKMRNINNYVKITETEVNSVIPT